MAGKNGAIDLIVSKEAQAQIDLLLKDLELIEDKIITISRTGIGKKAGFVDVKSQKELAKSLEENKRLSVELAASRKELIAANKKLTGTVKQEKSAYDQLNASQKTSLKAYNDLLTKKAMGTKLSKEEIAQLKQVEVQLKKNQKAYGQVAAGQNKLGISSKRTGVAFDSLGFSVAQLTRESPAFLNSVQTGFMALSNNIPIFVDEVDRLIKKNKMLKASGEETKSVFKSVGKAFFSMQSLISLTILLITVLGPKLFEMAKGWWNAGKAIDVYAKTQEDLNKVKEDSLKSTAKEIAQLKIMNIAVQDVTKSTKDRQEILNQLRAKYGDDIKHLSDRQILTKGLADAEEMLAKKMLSRAMADAAAGLIGENTVKLLKLQLEARELATEQEIKSAEVTKLIAQKEFDRAVARQNTLNGINDDLITNGLKQAELMNSNNELMKIALENTDGLGKKTKELGDARERVVAITGPMLAQFKEEGTMSKKLIENYIEMMKALGDLEGYQKRLAAAELSDGFLKILQGEDVMLKIAADSLKDFKAGMADLPPELQRVADMLAYLQEVQKNGVETQKSFQKNLAEAAAIATQSVSALADIGAGFTSRTIQRLEMEMDAYNERYELQKDLINKEVDDEASKNQRLEELDKEKRLKQKQIDKKIAEEKKKQAIIDRTAALFQIAISTAVWATRVGAEASIFGIALQPLIWALGGLNAAAVLAQPMPQFKDGHLAGTYEGQAMINDGGNIEIMERRGGQLELSTQKNKIVSMQRGDKVHKDIPSFLNSLPGESITDSLHSASILSAVQMASAQSNIERRIFDEQFKEAMLETMAKGFGKARIVNDNRSVGEAVKEAISEQNYTKNFL